MVDRATSEAQLTEEIMATEDDRKPSFGFDRGGKPFVRGFRSKPGAPMHDPTSNIPIQGNRAESSLTPQTNWERLFQPQMTGVQPSASGSPTLRFDGFDSAQDPSFGAAGIPGTPSSGIMDDEQFGGGNSLQTMAAGGMNHAQRWSQPQAKLSGGWQSSNAQERRGIVDQYGSKKGNLGFGWGSAFDKQNG